MVAIVVTCALQIQQIFVAVSACHSRNNIITSFEKFIDGTLERSRTAYKATIASPTSTAEQKLVAQSNLSNLDRLVKEEHDTLKLEDCTFPPRNG